MKIAPVPPRWTGLSRNIRISSILLVLLAFSFSAVFSQETTSQLPLSPIERAEQEGTALPLSLMDITKLALQNNLDIAISDTNEEIMRQRIFGAYGNYDPQLTFSMNTGQRRSPNTRVENAAVDANYSQNDTIDWSAAFNQNISTGGRFSVSMSGNRNDSNQVFNLFNPQYASRLSVSFNQPLRRNFRTDATRANIRIVNLDRDINDSQFRQMVTDTIANVQSQYWNLVGAIRDYEIQRESVKLAQITVDNNTKKVEIGTLAPIGITEARADMANREVTMIASEERIFSFQNSLRQQISNDRSDDIWQKMIVPTDTPEFTDFRVELNQAIETALKNRPELEQLSIQMEQNDINYELGANQKKWAFDLTASYGSTGIAGPQSFGPDGNPTIAPQFVGGALHSAKVLFTEAIYNWSVGFNLTIPLKNRSLESQLGQLRVQKQQHLMNRKVREQQIIVEIRNAVQAIETNKQRVETAQLARELAEEQLDGENKRFQAGLSENFQVLQRQRDLANSQGQELNALVQYRQSIISLQRAMYTLLDSSEINIAKEKPEPVAYFK